MPIIGANGLSGYVKKLLFLILIGGLLILLGLPWILKWYLGNFTVPHDTYIFLLIFLYFTGVFCLWIVYEMNRIFHTISRANPFQMDNVKSLNRIGLACFVICGAYIVKIFCYNSFLTIIIMMIFLIAGLFSIVLAELFRQAAQYKEENDLTI